MLTELTYNDLEVTQGGAVCRMPNVNSKEGPLSKTVGYHHLNIEAVKPIRWFIYLSVLLCKNLKLRFLFDKNFKSPYYYLNFQVIVGFLYSYHLGRIGPFWDACFYESCKLLN